MSLIESTRPGLEDAAFHCGQKRGEPRKELPRRILGYGDCGVDSLGYTVEVFNSVDRLDQLNEDCLCRFYFVTWSTIDLDLFE